MPQPQPQPQPQPPPPPQPQPPPDRPARLMDHLRDALRSRHYSRRTEQAYTLWVRRYIHFHQLRHPAEMAEPEINGFLTHLAVDLKVSSSTQTQALSALLFLYRRVLNIEIGELAEVVRSRKHELAEILVGCVIRLDAQGDHVSKQLRRVQKAARVPRKPAAVCAPLLATE